MTRYIPAGEPLGTLIAGEAPDILDDDEAVAVCSSSQSSMRTMLPLTDMRA